MSLAYDGKVFHWFSFNGNNLQIKLVSFRKNEFLAAPEGRWVRFGNEAKPDMRILLIGNEL
jgi:hypothetical protein